MNNSKYSLRFISDMVKGYELNPIEEREVILCILALLEKGCNIGDAVQVDNHIYMMGFRGLFTIAYKLEAYETFGYVYLEERAKKVDIKLLKKEEGFINLCGMIDAEKEVLQLAYKKRIAPKDLVIENDRKIIDEKDKQLVKLEDEYKSTLKNVDLLSSTLVKQVQENKKLQAKVKAKK